MRKLYEKGRLWLTDYDNWHQLGRGRPALYPMELCGMVSDQGRRV